MVIFAEVWPLTSAVGIFTVAAVAVLLAGTRLTAAADELADRTGLGEALMGAILLGALTSLPGITATATAALNGEAQLALANAYGGIAAQTAFLAIADIVYKRANLEHAAASAENMVMGCVLIILLGVSLLGLLGPNWTFAEVHPVSPLLFLGYFYLMPIVRQTRQQPMWTPTHTRETREDKPDIRPGQRALSALWLRLVVFGSVIVASGWALTRAGSSISSQTEISQTAIGAVGIAVATSLPELVIAVTAVRRGALTLAVGGILGGNAFDCLFGAVGDLAYRDGSIFHAATNREAALIALSIAMAGILVMGLLRRQERGPGRIGFESILVLALYLAGMVMISAFPTTAALE